jgi:hypothetical protein
LFGIVGGYIFFRVSRPYFKEGIFDYDSMGAKNRAALFSPFLVVFLLLMSSYFLRRNRLLASWMAILFLTFSGYLAVEVVRFERENHQRIYSKNPPGISIEMVFINGCIGAEIFTQIVFGF